MIIIILLLNIIKFVCKSIYFEDLFREAFEEISFRSIFYDKSQLSHSNNCTSDERIQNRQAGLIKLN